MKSKFRIALVAAVAAAGLMATAGAANFDHCADQLKDLGLFQGTEQGYELDRAPTRAEAATMLVRLLGKEDEAKALDYTAPFTDLAGWEKPYVQYLYENGLTTGVTETTFKPDQGCSAQMYTTFLLVPWDTAMQQTVILPMQRRYRSVSRSVWLITQTAIRITSCATMLRR